MPRTKDVIVSAVSKQNRLLPRATWDTHSTCETADHTGSSYSLAVGLEEGDLW